MRRTKADIDSIKLSIYDLCDRYQPMTVRQLFYQLTTIGAIDKTEAEYKGTVCRLTKEMRLNGELPWDWWQTTPVGCTSHAPTAASVTCWSLPSGHIAALCGTHPATLITARSGSRRTP